MQSKRKYYYVYRLNFEDGSTYVGSHKSNYPVDNNYKCSSKSVLELIENGAIFTREILEYCNNNDDLSQKEKEYIIKEKKENPFCLNKSTWTPRPEIKVKTSYRGIRYLPSESNLKFNNEQERYEYWHNKYEEKQKQMTEREKLIEHIYSLMD